jgi:succinate dehydrogenase / fumarate reductase cytochrome b subunit
MVMSTMNRDLREKPGLLDSTNDILEKAGLHYSGGVKVKQLLWVLAEDYGFDRLSARVTRPLSRLRVAPFYGCHSLRPSSALGFDDPEKPWSLEAAIRALGAEVVEYTGKTKCCGFQCDLVTEEVSVEMTGRRLSDASDKGADCVVTPCPFCHINLDNYQGLAEKKIGEKLDIPTFHFAQLVGLAMGLSADQMGLDRHLVSAEKIVS